MRESDDREAEGVPSPVRRSLGREQGMFFSICKLLQHDKYQFRSSISLGGLFSHYNYNRSCFQQATPSCKPRAHRSDKQSVAGLGGVRRFHLAVNSLLVTSLGRIAVVRT